MIKSKLRRILEEIWNEFYKNIKIELDLVLLQK
ncbi:hypothetical protein DFH87_001804 [Clostridium saccharobutylicum]|nr:hypothetical protein [Clostridium saccharobutylicum]